LFGALIGPGNFPEVSALFVGLAIAYVLGGGLLGAALGYGNRVWKSTDDRGDGQAEAATKTSGAAVAAAVLGLLGILVAVVFPARFRLPENYVFQVSMAMVGIRGIAAQAATLLAVLGLFPLIIGTITVVKVRRLKGALKGAKWASVGVLAGAVLALASLLLVVDPISPAFEARYALELLESVRGEERDWNYGNVIHDANLILGRVALKQGKIEKAKGYLVEAGKTPGSPQLNSYGPDMSLAEELVTIGEREAVVEYFNLCRSFWKRGEGRLDEWTRAVEAGEIPDFGRHSRQ
jgi:hypothetical protein